MVSSQFCCLLTFAHFDARSLKSKRRGARRRTPDSKRMNHACSCRCTHGADQVTYVSCCMQPFCSNCAFKNHHGITCAVNVPGDALRLQLFMLCACAQPSAAAALEEWSDSGAQ